MPRKNTGTQLAYMGILLSYEIWDGSIDSGERNLEIATQVLNQVVFSLHRKRVNKDAPRKAHLFRLITIAA